jgi:CubicO group peptidase (beta-lactamase class C family)
MSTAAAHRAISFRGAGVALALALAGCARPHPPAPPPPAQVQTADAELAATRPAVEALLAAEVARAKLPSFAFGLVSRRGLVYFVGLGERDGAGTPVTADTVYRIGSITKTMTGMALLELRDRGRLAFDDPVVRYVPELRSVRPPTTDSGPIRIRNLVTHSSGLPRMGQLDFGAWCEVTDGELRRAASSAVLDFAPGARSVYSNLGMALAGLVVEEASGQAYRSYMEANVFQPLGMTHTVWDPDQVPPDQLAKAWVFDKGAFVSAGVHWRLGAAEAMGGLYSSVADMALYIAFQLSAWPPRDGPDDGPLRRASVRESQLAATGSRPGTDAFGVNWIVRMDPRLGRLVFHDGATEGYQSIVWMVPERGVGVVALGPRSDAIGAIAMRALDRAIGAERPKTLGGPAQVAMRRVRRLLYTVDRAAIEAAFSPEFLASRPAESLVKFFQNFYDQVGDCGNATVVRADTPTTAEIEFTCQSHTARVVLEADPAPPHLVRALTVTLH